MQLYISQLIEDIAAASRSENSIKPVVQEDSFEAHIAEVERFISGEGYEPLRSILGLEEIQFPPVERLTDQQMESVVFAFKNCLFSWNVSAELPENIPVSLQYTLLVSTLSKNICVQDTGFIHLEFCNYCPEECPFGEEYCECKKFDFSQDDDINYNNLKTDELPF